MRHSLSLAAIASVLTPSPVAILALLLSSNAPCQASTQSPPSAADCAANLAALVADGQEVAQEGMEDPQLATELRLAVTAMLKAQGAGKPMTDDMRRALALANQLHSARAVGAGKTWKRDLILGTPAPIVVERPANSDSFIRSMRILNGFSVLSLNDKVVEVLVGTVVAVRLNRDDRRALELKAGQWRVFHNAAQDMITDGVHTARRIRSVRNRSQQLADFLGEKAAEMMMDPEYTYLAVIMKPTIERGTGEPTPGLSVKLDTILEDDLGLGFVARAGNPDHALESILKVEQLLNFGNVRFVGSVRNGDSKYGR